MCTSGGRQYKAVLISEICVVLNCKLKEEGGKIGLRINRRKSKVMRMNNRNNNSISLDGEDLEEVETFC